MPFDPPDRGATFGNYAYRPSCASDPRWACPLAPPASWLGVRIKAGERL